MKVGVLSGGGDAPGINAVIRAVVRKGIQKYHYDILGIKDGWRGLLENEFVSLDLKAASGILPRGGSILGTSRTNPFKDKKSPQIALKNAKKAGIGAFVVIGGDDTLSVGHQFSKLGLKCVGVPKTIDNDLVGTDYTFGFMTAVAIATEALDRLHTTAETHHRVMILEVMGRYTGWIALMAGLAGGADAILVPERPFDVKAICASIKRRQERGRNFSIIVVAEGARPKGGKEVVYSETVDEFGHIRLGGIGYYLGKEIERRLKMETRVVVLGHLQRGGSPTPFDRVLATRLGIAAIDLVHEKKFDHMVGIRGSKIIAVPLEKVIGKRKSVDPELYDIASVFFG
ncbi:6-phosphofructokinase [Candidatus Bathyarchaeota archaeon]|nr:6-phosphofructokinase [Candidatus Bathyarchaeota archaeon]